MLYVLILEAQPRKSNNPRWEQKNIFQKICTWVYGAHWGYTKLFCNPCICNMHIIPNALSLLVVVVQCVPVMNINYISAPRQDSGEKHSTQLWDRAVDNCKNIWQHVITGKLNTLSAASTQLITAKIEGWVLKQWSAKVEKTNAALRQDSSQLQKHKAARMSRRIAVERRSYVAVRANYRRCGRPRVGMQNLWWLKSLVSPQMIHAYHVILWRNICLLNCTVAKHSEGSWFLTMNRDMWNRCKTGKQKHRILFLWKFSWKFSSIFLSDLHLRVKV